jgi:acyl-CoA synthetase (AMP-forming)/AMP-acid ligase II
MLEEQAGERGDHVALKDRQGRLLTFGELHETAEAVASALFERGMGPGTRVAWQLPTSIETLVLVFALSRIGAVQCLVLPLLRDREVTHILQSVQPSFLVVPDTWQGHEYRKMATRCVTEAGIACTVVPWDRPLPRSTPVSLPAFADIDSQAGDARWVFFTSGTTGPPKAVLHSDETIGAGGVGLAQRVELRDADVFPVAFPLTHVGGINTVFAQMFSGMRLVVTDRFDGAATLDWFAEEKITIGSGGTTLVQLMLRHQRAANRERLYPRLRCALGGQAPKPRSLQDEVRKELGGVGIVSVYGMTEAPSATMCDLHDSPDVLAATEGRAIMGVDVRVVADDGSECAPGVTGEIRIRGAIVCLGYDDPSLNADAFDDRGFLRTGDLGELTTDGYLIVSGRLKDVIIRKGENISAKDVEDVLSEHPKVLDVAVIGIPDDERGELCCAVVVPTSPDARLDFDEMVQWCRGAGLAVHAVPERLEIMYDLPRNSTGKVLKRDLRKHFA